MKKPEYMSITLPEVKVPVARPIQKYLSGIVGKVVTVNFGQHRYRKQFEYVVESAKAENNYWTSAKPNKVPVVVRMVRHYGKNV